MDYQSKPRTLLTPQEGQIKNRQLPFEQVLREIKISQTSEQAPFNRQIYLKQQISKLFAQKQILQDKVLQLQQTISKFETTVFVEKQKNRQLQQKIDEIINQNVSAQQFDEMEQTCIRIRGQLNNLNIENHELMYQVDELKQKQLQLERVLVEYESLKMRCQEFQLNNEKYKTQITRMKKKLRDFEDEFYNASKKPITKKDEKEMEISLTEKKLEFMTVKLHEFEKLFNKKQLATFEKIKDDIIQNYEQYLNDEVQKINKKLEIKDELEKKGLIQEEKMRNQKELAYNLREVERKIYQYKANIKIVKPTREEKSVRERIDDLEQKMTQLSNSKIITSLNLPFKNSKDKSQQKNNFAQENQQQSPNKNLINPANYMNSSTDNSNITNPINKSNNLSQKNTSLIQPNLNNPAIVSQIGIDNSDNLLSSSQVTNQRFSIISPQSRNAKLSKMSPPSNYANLSNISQTPINNSKLSSINQPFISKISKFSSINPPLDDGHLSSIKPSFKNFGRQSNTFFAPPVLINELTGRYEYENGVQIPTQEQFDYLQHELKSLKTQLSLHQNQIKDYQVEYHKTIVKNNDLYKQTQKWKEKFQDLQNEITNLKASHTSTLTELNNANSTTLKFQLLQIQALKQQNCRLSKLVNLFETQIAKFKITKHQLQQKIDSLKKNHAFTETIYQTKITQIHAQIASKTVGISTVKMREEIQRKNIILQKQLQENLSLTNQVQQQQNKIQQLQNIKSQLSSSISDKNRQIQNLTKNLRDLTLKVQSLTQDILQKNLRAKKTQQNLSLQMTQKRGQISTLKKQLKKLQTKMEQIKELHQHKIQKKDRKYRKLEQKLIGFEKTNESLKESLRLSGSMQLKKSVISKSQSDEKSQKICIQKDVIKQNESPQ